MDIIHECMYFNINSMAGVVMNEIPNSKSKCIASIDGQFCSFCHGQRHTFSQNLNTFQFRQFHEPE